MPELLVAMSVMVLVIFSATNLVVSIIRSNTGNINTLLAYGLAQEGIEAVRNIRDSDWLLGSQFDGVIRNNQIWGEKINNSIQPVCYTVDIANLQNAQNPRIDVAALSQNVPWKLNEIQCDPPDFDQSLIKKFTSVNSSEFRYGHTYGAQQGEDTPFHRYIEISRIPTPYDKINDFNKMRVASIVTWMESGRVREVRLDSELTDWNRGQL